jgi:hypothetical protein
LGDFYVRGDYDTVRLYVNRQSDWSVLTTSSRLDPRSPARSIHAFGDVSHCFWGLSGQTHIKNLFLGVLLTAEDEEGGKVVGLDQRKVARVVCE